MPEDIEASSSELERLRSENERLRNANGRLRSRLADRRSRLQQIVSDSPLLVREVDMGPLIRHLGALRAEGITDFGTYFYQHPEQIPLCIEMARVVYANKNILKLYGARNLKELQQAIARDMTPERWGLARVMLVAVAEQRPLPSFETYIRTLHSEERYVVTQVSYLTPPNSPAPRVLFLSIDATEHKQIETVRRQDQMQAEAALREREALYRRVIDAADAVVYQMNAQTGAYDYLGAEIEQLTGYRPDEFTLRTWTDMQGKTYMRGGMEGMHIGDAVALHREGKIPRWKADTNYRHRKGEWRWVSDSSVPIFDPDGKFVGSMGILVDITERKRLEEQLLQVQKMESLGRLAGGIAHDFNNLLAIILGFAELAQEELPSDHPATEYLNKIYAATERGREITGRLLVFARKQTYTPQALDLGALVEKMADLLRTLLGPEVRLEIQQDADLWPVLVHAGQFEQVLINLVGNARDAMPAGGTLTLALRNVQYTPVVATPQHGLQPNECVCLTVRDTGIGMTAEVRARIFEPFFTTKPVGGGTGLGLTIAYSILKQSGGFIEVDTEPGYGATFNIYLPRIYGPLTEQAGLVVTDEVGGSETILLVEDETALRQMASVWLQRRGYLLLEASNGEEALAVAARHAAQIHLLLSDIVMPKMGGFELAQRLVRLRPDIRILFTTGYPDDPLLHHSDLAERSAILQKPYSFAQLAHAVRQALEGVLPLPMPREVM